MKTKAPRYPEDVAMDSKGNPKDRRPDGYIQVTTKVNLPIFWGPGANSPGEQLDEFLNEHKGWTDMVFRLARK